MSSPPGGGGQQTPYIGSRISLISNSEIRYEGILYTVNTKESTIALAKVKSFGTENRPTDHPFPARDEVFEFIIFKASDIKDLMVCETPKPVPQLVPGLTYDPAIVSVSQQPSAGTGISALSPVAPGRQPVAPSGSSTRSDTPQQQHQQHQRGQSPNAGDRRRGGMGGGPRGAPRGWGHPHNQQQRGLHQGGAFGNRQFVHRGGQVYNNNNAGPFSYRNAAMSNMRGRGGPMNGGAMGMNQMGAFRGQGGYPHHRGGPRGGPGGARGARPGAQPIKFDSDYDFEKANEQFAETLKTLEDEFTTKAKIADEDSDTDDTDKEDRKEGEHEGEHDSGEGEHDDDAECFYDKTRSFFDKISCEALEREEGKNTRPNWKKERAVNTDTFGQAALRTYAMRRGGMGRGRGGGYYYRGGGRGRGGGGYYNPRPFSNRY